MGAQTIPSKLPPVEIVGICGSVAADSSTRRILAVALEGAASANANTTLIDLRDYQLPFAGGEGASTNGDVVRLSAQLKAAEGILLATPEYHGSYTGVLKNALDLMGFDEFAGKMIGLMGVGGGSIGAINALTHLRTVGRQLHAWVLPRQVSVSRAAHAFDTNGELVDPQVAEALRDMGREVARFARLHSTAAAEFVKGWEQASGEADLP